jgi:hypothetical protein
VVSTLAFKSNLRCYIAEENGEAEIVRLESDEEAKMTARLQAVEDAITARGCC